MRIVTLVENINNPAYLSKHGLSVYVETCSHKLIAFIKIPIGIKMNPEHQNRFILTVDSHRIDDELFLFSDITGQFNSQSNKALMAKSEGRYVQDFIYLIRRLKRPNLLKRSKELLTA